MTEKLFRPATRDSLFLWIMHRFGEVFADHALLKGGMALRLLDSPRSTNDLDYVFVPFRSKLDIISRIQEVIGELEDAKVEYEVHSKMMRATIRMDSVAIQVEAAVMLDCASTPMSTGGFAQLQGQPPQVIRIMSPEIALAHKLAAWNERRLMRDLFDCYFFVGRLEVEVDRSTLESRLDSVSSRIPAIARRKSMSLAELAVELSDAAGKLTAEDLRDELLGLIPEEEMAGLDLRMKAVLRKFADRLNQDL